MRAHKSTYITFVTSNSDGKYMYVLKTKITVLKYGTYRLDDDEPAQYFCTLYDYD